MRTSVRRLARDARRAGAGRSRRRAELCGGQRGDGARVLGAGRTRAGPGRGVHRPGGGARRWQPGARGDAVRPAGGHGARAASGRGHSARPRSVDCQVVAADRDRSGGGGRPRHPVRRPRAAHARRAGPGGALDRRHVAPGLRARSGRVVDRDPTHRPRVRVSAAPRLDPRARRRDHRHRRDRDASPRAGGSAGELACSRRSRRAALRAAPRAAASRRGKCVGRRVAHRRGRGIPGGEVSRGRGARYRVRRSANGSTVPRERRRGAWRAVRRSGESARARIALVASSARGDRGAGLEPVAPVRLDGQRPRRAASGASGCEDAPGAPRGDARKPGAVRNLEGHTDSVRACAVTPDGRHVVSASEDQTLKVWELASGRAVATLQGHTHVVRACAVTPDGRHVVSASSDKTLKVWELASGRPVATLQGHMDDVTACAVTPDGRHVVSASYDQTLKIWELASGRAVATLQGHMDDVTACAVTPDGRHVVSASYDQTLKVWELQSRCA
ncbi:MAG: WD40 repeat domain-containing protein [Deltaproteobacteria bacterium]|nr:MAG: WD40 repeat domain-containing protein [Deltaproteobacteria bacterium]